MPQRTIFIIQTNPSKDVYENMLKALDFTKNKLCQRSFDNCRKCSEQILLRTAPDRLLTKEQ